MLIRLLGLYDTNAILICLRLAAFQGHRRLLHGIPTVEDRIWEHEERDHPISVYEKYM